MAGWLQNAGLAPDALCAQLCTPDLGERMFQAMAAAQQSAAQAGPAAEQQQSAAAAAPATVHTPAATTAPATAIDPSGVTSTAGRDPTSAQPQATAPSHAATVEHTAAAQTLAAPPAPLPGVLIIGTDIPDLSAVVLRAACSALRSYDAVLGPAADGGYYLLGLRRVARRVFEGVQWSTEQVLAMTVERCCEAGKATVQS